MSTTSGGFCVFECILIASGFHKLNVDEYFDSSPKENSGIEEERKYISEKKIICIDAF